MSEARVMTSAVVIRKKQLQRGMYYTLRITFDNDHAIDVLISENTIKNKSPRLQDKIYTAVREYEAKA